MSSPMARLFAVVLWRQETPAFAGVTVPVMASDDDIVGDG
jgi:hypothetical protein